MVGGGGHAAASVVPGSQPTVDSCRQETAPVAIVVDTLEESEFLRVGSVVAIDDLAGDMGMADDVPTLEGLGR